MRKKNITLKIAVDRTDVDKLKKILQEARASVQALASKMQNIELQSFALVLQRFKRKEG